MSNTKMTFWLNTITFPGECNIDILLREDEFCIQISSPDGRILDRNFVNYMIKMKKIIETDVEVIMECIEVDNTRQKKMIVCDGSKWIFKGY